MKESKQSLEVVVEIPEDADREQEEEIEIKDQKEEEDSDLEYSPRKKKRKEKKLPEGKPVRKTRGSTSPVSNAPCSKPVLKQNISYFKPISELPKPFSNSCVDSKPLSAHNKKVKEKVESEFTKLVVSPVGQAKPASYTPLQSKPNTESIIKVGFDMLEFKGSTRF